MAGGSETGLEPVTPFRERLQTIEPLPMRDFRKEIPSGNFKKKGRYSYVGHDGETYDIRNHLNSLSGRRWTWFLNSVEITDFPTSGPESYLHKVRRASPSPKPPQFMKYLIEFFTKEGGWVLDPFMGVGGTLLGGSLSNRNVLGIDISARFVEIYKRVTHELGLKEQIAICEDARNIEKVMGGDYEWFDCILTDPPYCNLQAKPKTGDKAKKGFNSATPFTEDKRDVGNVDYDTYLSEMKSITEKSLLYLKPGKYLVMFTKDLQPTRLNHNLLHADLIRTLSQVDGLEFRGYKIWFDRAQNLYPFGYPFEYVSNQFHQFILIFRKRRN